MATRTTCPHCSAVIAEDWMGVCFRERYADERTYQSDADGFGGVDYQLSPCCNRYIVRISDGRNNQPVIWPNSTAVKPITELVPRKYAQDYEEAEAVLSISPKASAALTRRCLQHFLETEANAKESSPLAQQIEYAVALSPPIFPKRLGERLDHIRVIGNFAAHPKKNTNTGEVIDVEPDEAAYLLDVLGEVFVHHYIEPPTDAARKARINEKLAATKKPKV